MLRSRPRGKAKGAKRRSDSGAAAVAGQRLFGWLAGLPGARLALWRRRGLQALAAVIFGACVWGSLKVREAVRSDERLSVANWQLRFADVPVWVTPEIEEELVFWGERCPESELTVLDAGAVDWLTACLESSPWVRTVDRIELIYPTSELPGVLDVEVWLREPVALVAHGDLYYLTDSEGRRLGAPYDEAPAHWFQVPVVTGIVDAGVLPAPGDQWPSQDVRQGVDVARILHEDGIFREFRDPPIAAIDMSNLHGHRRPGSEISLVWGDKLLAWGRSHLSASVQTATVEQTLRTLRKVLSHPEVSERFAVIYLHHGEGPVSGLLRR